MRAKLRHQILSDVLFLLQKDLLLKSLGILLDILLLSLDKAYLVPKCKSFASLFQWASYLLMTEQGLEFSGFWHVFAWQPVLPVCLPDK